MDLNDVVRVRRMPVFKCQIYCTGFTFYAKEPNTAIKGLYEITSDQVIWISNFGMSSVS